VSNEWSLWLGIACLLIAMHLILDIVLQATARRRGHRPLPRPQRSSVPA
jgi:hypothetical protein